MASPYQLGDELLTSTVGSFVVRFARVKYRSLFYLNIINNAFFFLKIRTFRNEIVMAILSRVSQRALWLRRISSNMNF